MTTKGWPEECEPTAEQLWTYLVHVSSDERMTMLENLITVARDAQESLLRDPYREALLAQSAVLDEAWRLAERYRGEADAKVSVEEALSYRDRAQRAEWFAQKVLDEIGGCPGGCSLDTDWLVSRAKTALGIAP